MEESPHKLEELRSKAFSDHITHIERHIVEEELQQQYAIYKEHKDQESKWFQIRQCCQKLLINCIMVAHELWR